MSHKIKQQLRLRLDTHASLFQNLHIFFAGGLQQDDFVVQTLPDGRVIMSHEYCAGITPHLWFLRILAQIKPTSRVTELTLITYPFTGDGAHDLSETDNLVNQDVKGSKVRVYNFELHGGNRLLAVYESLIKGYNDGEVKYSTDNPDFVFQTDTYHTVEEHLDITNYYTAVEMGQVLADVSYITNSKLSARSYPTTNAGIIPHYQAPLIEEGPRNDAEMRVLLPRPVIVNKYIDGRRFVDLLSSYEPYEIQTGENISTHFELVTHEALRRVKDFRVKSPNRGDHGSWLPYERFERRVHLFGKFLDELNNLQGVTIEWVKEIRPEVNHSYLHYCLKAESYDVFVVRDAPGRNGYAPYAVTLIKAKEQRAFRFDGSTTVRTCPATLEQLSIIIHTAEMNWAKDIIMDPGLAAFTDPWGAKNFNPYEGTVTHHHIATAYDDEHPDQMTSRARIVLAWLDALEVGEPDEYYVSLIHLAAHIDSSISDTFMIPIDIRKSVYEAWLDTSPFVAATMEYYGAYMYQTLIGAGQKPVPYHEIKKRLKEKFDFGTTRRTLERLGYFKKEL